MTGPATGSRMVPRAEPGGFSQCMVEGDSEGLARARRLRRQALAVSIALQALCVAALLTWPLLAAPGALPPLYVLTPVPPYRGGGRTAAKPQLRRARAPVNRSPFAHRLLFPTANAQTPVREASGESAQEIPGAIEGFGSGGTAPAAPWIPGGLDTGVPPQPPRPAAPLRPRICKVSEGVMSGALIRRVEPHYPAIALDLHLSGTVRLQAIIDTDGRVQDLEVLTGDPILARAAVAAVRQWRYRPTLLDGAPVEVETYITVNFLLSR